MAGERIGDLDDQDEPITVSRVLCSMKHAKFCDILHTHTDVHCVFALHKDAVVPRRLCGLQQKVQHGDVAKFRVVSWSTKLLILKLLIMIIKIVAGRLRTALGSTARSEHVG